MNSISLNLRYLPHELKARIFAVELYRKGNSSNYVCRRYHISKSSLSRQNRINDDTKKSLMAKSPRPPKPLAKTYIVLEIKWIDNYLRRKFHITS